MTFPPDGWPPSATSLVWFAILHSLWLGTALASLSRPRRIPLALAAILPGSLLAAALHITILSHPTASEPLRVVVQPEAPSTTFRPTEPRPSASPAPRSAPSPSIPARLSRALDAVRPAALAAWSIGVLLHLGMLILGLVGSLRLARSGVPAPDPLSNRARRLADPLPLARMPEVRLHPTIVQPCLAGLIRPRILLPRDWAESAEPDALDAVLAHELAHAARLDTLTALGQRLIVALLFYHPAVRRLERLARHGRELRADAMAARLTDNPLALAEAIASVARQTLAPRPRRFSPTWPRPLLPGVGDPPLRERIQEILGMTPQPQPRRSLILLVALPFTLLAAAADLPQTPPTQGKSDPKSVRRVVPEPPQVSFDVTVVDVEKGTCQLHSRSRSTTVTPDDPGREWIIQSLHPRLIVNPELGRSLTITTPPKFTLVEGQRQPTWPASKSVGLITAASYKDRSMSLHADLIQGTPGPGPFKTLRTLDVELPEAATLVIRHDQPDRPDQMRFYLITPLHILTEAEEGKLMKTLPDPPRRKRPTPVPPGPGSPLIR